MRNHRMLLDLQSDPEESSLQVDVHGSRVHELADKQLDKQMPIVRVLPPLILGIVLVVQRARDWGEEQELCAAGLLQRVLPLLAQVEHKHPILRHPRLKLPGRAQAPLPLPSAAQTSHNKRPCSRPTHGGSLRSLASPRQQGVWRYSAALGAARGAVACAERSLASRGAVRTARGAVHAEEPAASS
eukprot:CAMPEP_0195653492 /NCGR_PEP_ID=MMETSP0815-20121206/33422_1 /TAXON_ID=97485 /ORGANISM="Prymnesium parvum, Strain Texoma1" /LENGTH=185 /DNA_ID=CAMNT_0040797653 /DNA_START=19 /DNA_END=577 /DNA_ORIENTATION=-